MSPSKIAVCLLSRGRSRKLSSVITALDELSSDKNEILYFIGCDNDDPDTLAVADKLTREIKNVFPIHSERPLTLGHAWNALVTDAKERFNPDFFMTYTDDAIPLSHHWDEKIRYLTTNNDVVSWYGWDTPGEFGNYAVTRKWYENIGYLCIPHFPFWFADTWTKEVYQFIYNRDVLVSRDLLLGGRKGKTTNLRHLDFWWGFFNATRILRIKEAYKISKFNGDEIQFTESRKEWIENGNFRDRYFRERIDELTKALGDASQPSARYILAKKNAEKFLIDNHLTSWSEKIV